jgi:uncharacterized protein (DUF2252 family)
MSTGRTRTPATPAERRQRGRDARAKTPRAGHGEWRAADDRADPIELLEAQARSRVPELVPIRYGRMAASPFAFYRGAAAVMAGDLASTADSGIRVQLCGDAHLSNFGVFGSPERTLVFDLNDFDETLPGPWEWDLKRLAASVAVAGRQYGFTSKQRAGTVSATVREYHEAMRRFASMRNLDVWYARLDEADIRARMREQGDSRQRAAVERIFAKATRKDSARAYSRLVAAVDGEPQIVSDPPLIVRLDELLPRSEADDSQERMRELLAAYVASLAHDRRHLIERYRFVDLARKVVGVGSVGTRAWIALMLGRDDEDPLLLQCKEAQPSVLEPFAGRSRFNNHGRRVVEGQRLMQASSDIMLGWLSASGADGDRRDFYVRQLWDWKGSADLESTAPPGLAIYGRMCGWTLARSHACSGDGIAISGYLGSSARFDDAIVRFAETYADQNERDHRALLVAIDSGRVVAQAAA